MMYLIQLFLPLYDENGSAISDQDFAAVRDQLTEKFGGITTYPRAPAKGFWKDRGKVHKDDIVVFEVMAEGLERQWWDRYRKTLEARFRQEEVLIRAQVIEII
ncbi:MAG TPA: hypothetical protein VHP35_18680 [Terriglobia bacterium]|nr:hypothetical protein [Terriglobia bacterium]